MPAGIGVPVPDAAGPVTLVVLSRVQLNVVPAITLANGMAVELVPVQIVCPLLVVVTTGRAFTVIVT